MCDAGQRAGVHDAALRPTPHDLDGLSLEVESFFVGARRHLNHVAFDRSVDAQLNCRLIFWNPDRGRVPDPT